MLNNDQLELIADVIRPLYQYLEHEVIYDIARRIKKTMTYTRTAELMAMEMEKLGYAPAKIRAEAMKVLKADSDYQRAVEENTLEYKKEIKELIKKIEAIAESKGDTIVAAAGDMEWIDDMRVWESNGKILGDDSVLEMLQRAIAEQTAMELKNLTRSTGFKTMAGFENLEDAYRRELDRAVIKICTGTFSQEKVLNDTVHELAQSGLRTINYASGRKMQIDTAAKLALRTGCHQICVKIHDHNIISTGVNLVYVSKHWGARNEGTGIENHEKWQGKVYYIKPGKDYSDEAKRIEQDRIMDIWYSTGYSPDGSHENNPLGLHGYNCRHLHMAWFEGSSSLPVEDPEPPSKIINGKIYDYYHMTQKCRSMERGIRALKREKIVMDRLGMPTNEIKAKISEKTKAYKMFCDSCNMPEKTTNLRVDSDTIDITKSDLYNNVLSKIDESDERGYFRTQYDKILNKINGHEPVRLYEINSLYKNEIMGIYRDKTSVVSSINQKYMDSVKFVNEKVAGKGVASKDGISVNLEKDSKNVRGAWTTTFHEIGHQIDRSAGRISVKEKLFGQYLRSDFKELVRNYQTVYNVSENQAYKEIGMMVSDVQYHSVSDLFGALSENKCVGDWKHSVDYWKKPYKLEKEAFAHFYEAFARKDGAKIDVLNSVFPNATAEFLRMVNKL